MADALGVTERSAYAIVADLTEAGYVVKERDGRRNRYSIQHHMPLARLDRPRAHRRRGAQPARAPEPRTGARADERESTRKANAASRES